MNRFHEIKSQWNLVKTTMRGRIIPPTALSSSDIDYLIEQAEKVERYEIALKAYGDEEGKHILKALDESEEFVKKFNNGEIG